MTIADGVHLIETDAAYVAYSDEPLASQPPFLK
jgi:hypothetical protein